LWDEGLGLVGERVVEADFGCLRHFWGAKETTIVAEGRGKTNSLTESCGSISEDATYQQLAFSSTYEPRLLKGVPGTIAVHMSLGKV
jgi:hypothetical protein